MVAQGPTLAVIALLNRSVAQILWSGFKAEPQGLTSDTLAAEPPLLRRFEAKDVTISDDLQLKASNLPCLDMFCRHYAGKSLEK